jgi:hypothetical protein
MKAWNIGAVLDTHTTKLPDFHTFILASSFLGMHKARNLVLRGLEEIAAL